MVVGLIIRLRDRPIKPQPLPLKTVEWKFPSKVNWIASVDLNADGRSELLVEDENKRLWWAEWNGKKPSFEPVPIQTPRLVYHLFGEQIFAAAESNSLLLVTRSNNKWQKVRITAKSLAKMPMYREVARILDLDSDGNDNDALILTDFQTLEWWQRKRNGKLALRDRLKLPKRCDCLWSAESLEWVGCDLMLSGFSNHAFISVEKGKLLWKGAFALQFRWTDADIDGDGTKDRVEWMKRHNKKEELFVRFADGKVQALELPEECSVTVRDIDGDGQAEIFVSNFTQAEHNQWRRELTLWRFDRKNTTVASLAQ